MALKRCDICKQDFFDVVSDVCPNHVGHVLHLIPPSMEVFDEAPKSTPVPPEGEERIDAVPFRAVPVAPEEVGGGGEFSGGGSSGDFGESSGGGGE